MKFPILSENLQTITTIFNSKIVSISSKDFLVDYARIDILDENIDQINSIVQKVLNGNRLEGTNYTNGNLNREI